MKNQSLKQIILVSIIAFSAYEGRAFPSEEIEIDGAVKSFNDKEVEIRTNKFVYVVPRNLIMLPGLKPEQKISITLSKTRFAALKKIELNKN